MLAARALVAGGAGAGHLSQPGDEGALPVVETVAGDGTGGTFCGKENPPDRSPHHWSGSLGSSCCCCCSGGASCGLTLLNVDLDGLLVLSPGVERHTGVLAAVRQGDVIDGQNGLVPEIMED